MKKKILFVLFITVIICLFAFSVSADNEVTLVGGTKANFATVFKINSNNIVTGFNDGYTKDSVTDVIFPDEIDGIEANYLFNKAANLNTLTFAATDEFFISGDGIFSECSVKTITFNPDCIVELRKGNFSSCASLTQITFPKFSKMAGSAFKSCSNMVNTNELVFAEGMTEIGGHVFNGCKSVKGTVYFPASLEKIQEYSFQDTGFSSFDLSKCSNLTLVGGSYGGPFNGNTNLVSIDMSACVNLTSISKGNLFANCTNLENVILPPNLTNLPEKAFSNCHKLQSLVLPASCTDIGVEAFQYARKNQELQTFTLYVQGNIVFDTSKYSVFQSSNAKVEIVIIGDGVTAESLKAANDYTHVTGATVFDYLDEDSKWTYTPGGTITEHRIVENYCRALGLTDKHSETDEICANDDYCTYCEYHTLSPHEGVTVVVYPNGYCANGEKRACDLTVCNGSKPVMLEPIFEPQGYSIKEKKGYGIASSFFVNVEALEELEAVNGKLQFGIIMANADFNEVSEFMSKNEEGKYVLNSSRGVQIEILEKDYSSISLAIDNFTSSQADLKLVIALYVVDKDGITYIQHSGTYAGTVSKGDVTLDVVTISKIAELVDITLPFVVPTQAEEIKENL